MILQYSEILQYHLNLCLRAVYGTLTAAILRSMLGLCCDETYGAMTNYNDEDDNGDNYGNKDGNDDDNAASESGSDGPIFDRSRRLGLAEEDRATMTTALQPRHTMYICVRLYIYPTKTILKMCHKLLHANIGVLDLCC